jgi:oxygen-independent coproporphyrinogen III oxidase
MLESMLYEIELRSSEINEPIETIYFGGGTPSLLDYKEIKSFIAQIKKFHIVSEDAEVTLEANPDDISKKNILDWKKVGINRLSVGLQSFDEEDLTWMNRAHTAQESLEAIKTAKKYEIENISVDLIYGLPNMDLKRWEKQINIALELDVKHISAYCLTVESKTALHKMVESKKIVPVDNEMQSLHFELLQNKLKENNFIQYEVSNFGKENYFSRHNSSYWKGKQYQGLGPSAHSYQSNIRSWNVANNTKYIKSLQQKILPSESETLSKENQFNEALLIGLRTIWGVDLNNLGKIIPLSTNFNFRMNSLIKKNQAKIVNNHLILTENGLHYADKIAMDLFV